MINILGKFEWLGWVYICLDWDDVCCKLVLISFVGMIVWDVGLVVMILLIVGLVDKIGVEKVWVVLLVLCELCL